MHVIALLSLGLVCVLLPWPVRTVIALNPAFREHLERAPQWRA